MSKVASSIRSLGERENDSCTITYVNVRFKTRKINNNNYKNKSGFQQLPIIILYYNAHN